MPTFAFELVIVLLLIVLNGAFAMSEMAIVSARKPRLEHRAEGGDRRARIALNMANDPNELLSTIQVGITLIGIINGVYGGASLAAPVAEALRTVPFLAPYSTPISFGLVVSTITYLSLVVGELVPKRLALSNPERVAIMVAVPMQALATIARPVVRLLSASNDFVLRLLGSPNLNDAPVTEDEIKLLIEQGTRAGVFHAVEQTLVERVFRLGDRHVGEVMTPRHEVVWLDVDDEPDELRVIVTSSEHSRFPVIRGTLDDVIGVVRAKPILTSAQPMDLLTLIEPPVFVPSTMEAFRVLELFRQSGTPMAIVVDEYGGTQGIVTPTDILEAIVGALPSIEPGAPPPMARLEDGSWSVDGMLSVDELRDSLDFDEPDTDERTNYRSLGGLVMSSLGRVPSVGDVVEWAGLRFEVLDMDGMRVDRIRVRALDADGAGSESDGEHVP
jgi:putative hemolysin